MARKARKVPINAGIVKKLIQRLYMCMQKERSPELQYKKSSLVLLITKPQ